jgi:hypothetical protein
MKIKILSIWGKNKFLSVFPSDHPVGGVSGFDGISQKDRIDKKNFLLNNYEYVF